MAGCLRRAGTRPSSTCGGCPGPDPQEACGTAATAPHMERGITVTPRQPLGEGLERRAVMGDGALPQRRSLSVEHGHLVRGGAPINADVQRIGRLSHPPSPLMPPHTDASRMNVRGALKLVVGDALRTLPVVRHCVDPTLLEQWRTTGSLLDCTAVAT